MIDLIKLKEIVRGRPVGIMVHGKSIENLEKNIYELKDYDICWASLGVFDMMEEFILSKIDKKLEVVFDCATVPHARVEHYELLVRKLRLQGYLQRPDNNIWITTHGLIRDSVQPYYPEFLEMFGDKMMQVDSIFPTNEISKWMDVPNSVCLLIASMIAAQATKIIIFGLDGYSGDITTGVNSYYQPNLIMQERIAALGTLQDPGINRDTDGFAKRWFDLSMNYTELFKNNCYIYNCSPNSVYRFPIKIKYEDLKGVLEYNE